MSNPFAKKAPSFKQIEYEFTYADSAAAEAAYAVIRNKRYTLLPNGDYVLPIGHRIKSRDEKVAGSKLTFIAQVRSTLVPDTPQLQELELEVAGVADGGAMTGKTVL